MTNLSTLRTPLGFDQGDPLIICRSSNVDDIRETSNMLRIKGYYCGPLSAVGGRRHDQIIFVMHNMNMSLREFEAFWRWINESVYTSLPPGGGKGVVFV